MDPMIDLDRELARSAQVDPSPDFTARVRARIAEAPPPSRWRVPRFAVAVVGAMVVGVLAVNRSFDRAVSVAPAIELAHRDVIALVPFRAPATASRPVPADAVTVAYPRSSDVIVSRSEMLALQRLFAGALAAPPETEVPDLSIPEIAVEALALPTIPEGDHR